MPSPSPPVGRERRVAERHLQVWPGVGQGQAERRSARACLLLEHGGSIPHRGQRCTGHRTVLERTGPAARQLGGPERRRPRRSARPASGRRSAPRRCAGSSRAAGRDVPRRRGGTAAPRAARGRWRPRASRRRGRRAPRGAGRAAAFLHRAPGPRRRPVPLRRPGRARATGRRSATVCRRAPRARRSRPSPHHAQLGPSVRRPHPEDQRRAPAGPRCGPDLEDAPGHRSPRAPRRPTPTSRSLSSAGAAAALLAATRTSPRQGHERRAGAHVAQHAHLPAGEGPPGSAVGEEQEPVPCAHVPAPEHLALGSAGEHQPGRSRDERRRLGRRPAAQGGSTRARAADELAGLELQHQRRLRPRPGDQQPSVRRCTACRRARGRARRQVAGHRARAGRAGRPTAESTTTSVPTSTASSGCPSPSRSPVASAAVRSGKRMSGAWSSVRPSAPAPVAARRSVARSAGSPTPRAPAPGPPRAASGRPRSSATPNAARRPR